MTLPEPGALLTLAEWRHYLTQQTGTLAWSLKLPALIARGDGPQLRFSDGDPMNEQEAAKASEFDAAILSSDLGLWFESRGHVIEHAHGAPAVEHAHGAPKRAPGRPGRQPGEGPIPASTVAKAREIAVQFSRAELRVKKRMPKLEVIAERVAGELQRAGIFNSRGQPYAARYLMRHALVGVQTEAQNYRKHAPNASAQIER